MLNSIARLPGAVPAPAPRGPSTPVAGAPTDGPRLDDYKPSILSYGKVAAYPLIGGGVGAAGGLSTTASIIAGVVTGGTVGLMVGAGIGMILDFLHLGKKQHATGKLAFVGSLVGGVAGGWGASMLPVIVTGGFLGVAGLALGLGIAKVASKGIAQRQERKIDQQAESGKVHISRLFRQIFDREGAPAPHVERDVRACEKLEIAGWHFGATRSTLQSHVTGTYAYGIQVVAPDGTHDSLPLHALPTLAYLNGVGDAADLDDPGLVDAVHRYASQGRPLSANNQPAPASADEGLIRLAAACDSLANGRGAAYVHDSVPMRVDARDGAGLDAAMKTVDELVSQYDRNLAPAFADGTLEADAKASVFESLLKTPYGPDLGRSAPLLIKLAKHGDARAGSATWQATSALEGLCKKASDRVPLEQSVDDFIDLTSRMPRDKAFETLDQMRETLSTVDAARVERFHDCFMRVLRATGDRAPLATRAVQILTGADPDAAQAQVSALERLAAAAAAQKDYKDVLLDQATVMAARRPADPLGPAVERYATLLGGLAALGKADEAAPTYAFMKTAVRDGRAISPDEDALIAQAVKGAQAGTDLESVRRAMLTPDGAAETQSADVIAKRLSGSLDERTTLRASHLFAALPKHDVEEQVAVFETLAHGASYQKNYGDLLLDYATLMAVRDPATSLADAASQYATLLSGLGSMNKADEAAPTYAFIRSGLLSGRFGTATFDQLSEKFLTALLAGADPRRARASLLQTVPTSDNTVKKDDRVVIIGGVAIPVHH